ncbi:MAG TPA: MFS transporter [Devosia sp.]|nr:MFS transporter [Devosia sp.]
MTVASLSPAPSLRVTSLITASLLFTGVGFAATVPYAGIVAIEGLGISNASYGLILTAGSLIGALASVVLGWLSDRIDDRRLLVIACSFIAVLGQGLVWAVREPWAFVVSNCVLMPLGGALYSQTLAFARAYLASRGGAQVDFLITMIRAIYAVSWVIAPPLAGWIAATYTVFDPFLVAGLAFLLCTLLFVLLLPDGETRLPSPRSDPAAAPPASSMPLYMGIGIAGIIAVTTAQRLNGIATPLAIINHWGGSLADVGYYAALAALIEIPFMVGWAFITRRIPLPLAIAIASAIYALYVWLAGNVTTMAQLYWLQGLNGISTAALMSLPIPYIQEAIRGRVGLSTSLLDVTFVVAGLVSSGVFALVAGENTYLPIFGIAAIVSVLGAVLAGIAHVMQQRR